MASEVGTLALGLRALDPGPRGPAPHARRHGRSSGAAELGVMTRGVWIARTPGSSASGGVGAEAAGRRGAAGAAAGPPARPRWAAPEERARELGTAQVARRLCAYVECPMVATMVNHANGCLQLLSPAQRRCAEVLLAREPDRRLAAEVGTLPPGRGGAGRGDAEGGGRWLQVALRSLYGLDRLTVWVHSGTEAGALRARIACGLGVQEEHVAILHQGAELCYGEPVPVPRRAPQWAPPSVFTVVVDAPSLKMDEEVLARALSHISTRARALSAVSTLTKKLRSCHLRDRILDYVASPLVERAAVEWTFRGTTSREALDACFAALALAAGAPAAAAVAASAAPPRR